MDKKVVDWRDKINNNNQIIMPKNSRQNSIFNFSPTNEDLTEHNNLESTAMVQAESIVWHGIKLEQKNNFVEAIECYRQAVKLNSRSAIAHHVLAIA